MKNITCHGNARYACIASYYDSLARMLLTDILNLVQNERHTYEKCQYEEFKKRVAKMEELRAATGGNRSN